MSQHLLDVLESLRGGSIMVVGDLILDMYKHGEVLRISPEAPIPVFDTIREDYRLGGALNVADNLSALGIPVSVAGVIGDDAWGRTLREMLQQKGIEDQGVLVDVARPTTIKTRLVAHQQQVLREDRERKVPLDGATRQAFDWFLQEHLDHHTGVLVSDYGKGVLTPGSLAKLIEQARARSIPVFIDPKGTDYSRYRGATLLTPNRKEAEQATGMELKDSKLVRQAGTRLLEDIELDAIVITLGADGVYFRTKEGDEHFVPTEARSVYDVTGAGDTVISILAWACSSGASLGDAVRIANHGAGIVVERFGAATVSRQELVDRLRIDGIHKNKVVQEDKVEDLASNLRQEGREVVFTNGCFDLLHPGHITYLRAARARGDILVIGVNSDESVRRLKGPDRPICDLAERMSMLAALEMVDYVVPFEEDTPLELIRRLSPDVLVKGSDWKGNVVGTDWVESHGGRVELVELVEGKSTSNLIERILRRSE